MKFKKLFNLVREKSLNGDNGAKKKNISEPISSSSHRQKSKYSFMAFIRGSLIVLISILMIYGVVQAGSLTPSASPAATMHSLADIAGSGFATATHSLEALYNKINSLVADIWDKQTSELTTSGSIGKLAADNLNSASATSTDTLFGYLKNIKDSVTLPAETDVKLNTSYGVSAAGSLTPTSGATGNSLTAVASDVASGKYFFGSADNDWTATLGTATIFDNYTTQKNRIYDDWKGSANSTAAGLATAYSTSVDQNDEEATWDTYSAATTTVALASDVVKKDNRTGLYWSDCYSAAMDGSCDTRTNSFTLDGVIADADDSLDAEDGQAVDFCESLILDGDGNGTDETDWYLPSQKELMQAYIDGSANNLRSPGHYLWSSTEQYSNTSYAWGVRLSDGDTANDTKTSSYYARCVRR